MEVGQAVSVEQLAMIKQGAGLLSFMTDVLLPWFENRTDLWETFEGDLYIREDGFDAMAAKIRDAIDRAKGRIN
jgi:hypothetical protein